MGLQLQTVYFTALALFDETADSSLSTWCQVPADGAVLRGNAAVDESMLTGESMPVHKHEGSDVIGATVSETVAGKP